MSNHDKSEAEEPGQDISSSKSNELLISDRVNDEDGEGTPRTESIFNPPLLNRIRRSLTIDL